MTPDELYAHMTRSRDDTLRSLSSQNFDVLIIGGGIVGASAFYLAATHGLKVALIDKQDFAAGSSSRSSNMFHGNLLDMMAGRWRLVKELSRERERWLQDYPELIERVSGFYLHEEGEFPSPGVMKWIAKGYKWLSGLSVYPPLESDQLAEKLPWLQQEWSGITQYDEVVVDDARLVQRLLNEGRAAGGVALNYLAFHKRHERDDGLWEIRARDSVTLANVIITAEKIINATGVWANWVSGLVPSIRPCRGSHLILPMKNHQVTDVIVFKHPDDSRLVYVWPWQGMLVVGCTHEEDSGALSNQPAMSMAEYIYLMVAIKYLFGKTEYCKEEVVGCFSGWRPLVEPSVFDESARSQDHFLWSEPGMVTIVGGSLTNSRLAAQHALEEWFANMAWSWETTPSSQVVDAGRLGNWIEAFSDRRVMAEEGWIDGAKTNGQWLLDACYYEQVETLSDLMLRRTRLAFQYPRGAQHLLDDIKVHCMEALGWSEQRWAMSQKNYTEEISRYFSVK